MRLLAGGETFQVVIDLKASSPGIRPFISTLVFIDGICPGCERTSQQNHPGVSAVCQVQTWAMYQISPVCVPGGKRDSLASINYEMWDALQLHVHVHIHSYILCITLTCIYSGYMHGASYVLHLQDLMDSRLVEGTFTSEEVQDMMTGVSVWTRNFASSLFFPPLHIPQSLTFLLLIFPVLSLSLSLFFPSFLPPPPFHPSLHLPLPSLPSSSGLCSVVKGDMESELIYSYHTHSLLLTQLLRQAEHWHLTLVADISALENQ